jgi:hypothetical protein
MGHSVTSYIPHNAQDHDDKLRAIAVSKMGTGEGNPSAWVIAALHQCWQEAFAAGVMVGRGIAKEPAHLDPAEVRMAANLVRGVLNAERKLLADEATAAARRLGRNDDVIEAGS